MNLLIGVRYNFYLNTEHLTFTEKVNEHHVQNNRRCRPHCRCDGAIEAVREGFSEDFGFGDAHKMYIHKYF